MKFGTRVDVLEIVTLAEFDLENLRGVKDKKTLAYMLVLPGSRARIVRCGGRYDPQLVKRSSE